MPQFRALPLYPYNGIFAATGSTIAVLLPLWEKKAFYLCLKRQILIESSPLRAVSWWGVFCFAYMIVCRCHCVVFMRNDYDLQQGKWLLLVYPRGSSPISAHHLLVQPTSGITVRKNRPRVQEVPRT